MPTQKYDRLAFVKAWLSCSSIADVATAMGMSVQAVNSLAANVRRTGVKLPAKYSRGVKAVYSVDALNKLIKEHKP